MPANNLIKFRRGTYTEWENNASGVLGSGEPGFVTDYRLLKIGDGITQWSDLPGVNDHLTTIVRNDTAATISKMSVVYINGAQGDLPQISLSIASGEGTSSKTYGLVVNDITTGNVGQVVVEGTLRNLNTLSQFSGVSPGTTLWLSPTVSGGITTIKPYAPNHMVSVGTLIRVHQNQGIINVKIQNGYELEELHNVATTGATNGQFLQYNSSSGLWIPSSSGNFSALSVNGSGVSVSGHTHTTSSITDFNSSVSGLLPTISNSGDNRVLTSTGSSLGINAESNLTFDGTSLVVSGDARIDNLKLDGNTLSSSSGNIIVNPSGTGALQRDSGGNARGQYAVDWQTVRTTGTMVAAGDYSVIGGGRNNTISGTTLNNTIGGGSDNTLNGFNNTVGGGYNNTISGTANNSTIGGGGSNTIITNSCATVCGGYNNTSSGYGSTVGGGTYNTSSVSFSTVGGGSNNTSSGSSSTIGGGSNNTSSVDFSTVCGGYNNTSTAYASTVGGGRSNSSSGEDSIVGGGYDNSASGINSTVGGGIGNTANGGTSFVGGGNGNTSSAGYASVIGGSMNTASGESSIVCGGIRNTTSGNYSIVGGGYRNTSSGFYSVICGGQNNLALSARSFVNGTNNVAASKVRRASNITSSTNTITVLNATAADFNDTTADAISIRYFFNNTYNSINRTVSSATQSGSNVTLVLTTNVGTTGQTWTQVSVVNTSESDSATGQVANGISNIASGASSTVSGGKSNTASGENSTVGGGLSNTSSGYASTVSGGANNVSSGTNSIVSGGNTNTSSGFSSTVSGGRFNTSSGTGGIIGGGISNTSSGSYSTIGGGNTNTSSGGYSTVPGGLRGKATRYGETSHASGRFAADGDAQHSILVARRSTTDATANVVLTLDGSTPSSSNRLTLPASTTWAFSIKLSAYNSTDNGGGWWIIRGGIRRNNSNNTALIGSLITESGTDSSLSSANISVVADDTNEALEIRVTGIASKTIRWVAVVDLSQVSFGTP